jgi:sugar-specific transcriptional regulator TrmB
MKKIQDYLVQLGLTEVESKLYEGLLDYGKSTVMELSGRLGINRITAHTNIENLKDLGLVTESRNGARRILIAEPPERLMYLIEQKEQSIKNLRTKFPDILDTINVSFSNPKQSEGIEVKYYEGRAGVQSIYREVIKSNELRSYVNISKIFELFPENPQLFPQNINKGNLRMWEFIEDSAISRNYVKDLNHDLYKYKFFTKRWEMDVFDYMIFNNKVAIITSDELNKVNCILIQSEKFYENAKFLFDMTWDLVPDPKKE